MARALPLRLVAVAIDALVRFRARLAVLASLRADGCAAGAGVAIEIPRTRGRRVASLSEILASVLANAIDALQSTETRLVGRIARLANEPRLQACTAGLAIFDTALTTGALVIDEARRTAREVSGTLLDRRDRTAAVARATWEGTRRHAVLDGYRAVDDVGQRQARSGKREEIAARFGKRGLGLVVSAARLREDGVSAGERAAFIERPARLLGAGAAGVVGDRSAICFDCQLPTCARDDGGQEQKACRFRSAEGEARASRAP